MHKWDQSALLPLNARCRRVFNLSLFYTTCYTLFRLHCKKVTGTYFRHSFRPITLDLLTPNANDIDIYTFIIETHDSVKKYIYFLKYCKKTSIFTEHVNKEKENIFFKQCHFSFTLSLINILYKRH